MSEKSRQILLGLMALLMVAGIGLVWWKVSSAESNQANKVTPKKSDGPGSVEYKVTSVAQGLQVPWSLVFTSEDRWLVSERAGAIRVVQNGKLQNQPLVSFSGVSSRSEEGLMGLTLDPDYSSNKMIYACYAYAVNGSYRDRVVKFEDKGTSVGPQTTLVDGIPAGVNHAGCRLGFGPDKKLYITTGDGTNKATPQNVSSLGGKILRINSDGSIPSDNPFSGSAVWSLGHRNPQGIAWQPNTNRLFATEHGPTSDGPPGGDEINAIQSGANYGWPVVSHEQSDSRFVSPILLFTPSVAPGGAAFYNSDVLPQFKNNFFFAALKGEGLYRVVFDKNDNSKVASHEKLVGVEVGRVRDVVQGPDGALYLLTSNQDGRGDPREGDDQIYRVGP